MLMMISNTDKVRWRYSRPCPKGCGQKWRRWINGKAEFEVKASIPDDDENTEWDKILTSFRIRVIRAKVDLEDDGGITNVGLAPSWFILICELPNSA